MAMRSSLEAAVLIAAVWSIVALAIEALRTRARGREPIYAKPAGSRLAGIAYAFGPGMSPTAKESARLHLRTWVAGVGYHIGILASFVALVMLLAKEKPGAGTVAVLQALTAVGVVCGVGLLGKRMRVRHLHQLSRPDDWLANGLTTLFVAVVLAYTFVGPTVEPVLLAVAAALLLYVPIGKIRHCLFFFLARYEMASLFGRRGALPFRR